MDTLQNETEVVTNFPWIVFRLGKSQCAISSERVSSITSLAGNVTEVPDSPAHVRGLISLRGEVMPLLDLRTVLGQATLLDEHWEFADMLEQRKQDHLRWAEELKLSIKNNTEFTLTTDPHKCAFGQWYDSYHDERTSVRFQLEKIDNPHKRLHQTAILAQEAKLLSDEAERESALNQIIEEVETKDIPAIVGLLDETSAVLKDAIREQVLVLGEDNQQVGCIVDEVVAVQELSPIGGKEVFSGLPDMRYLLGIAQNTNGMVLLLDESAFEQAATVS